MYHTSSFETPDPEITTIAFEAPFFPCVILQNKVTIETLDAEINIFIA